MDCTHLCHTTVSETIELKVYYLYYLLPRVSFVASTHYFQANELKKGCPRAIQSGRSKSSLVIMKAFMLTRDCSTSHLNFRSWFLRDPRSCKMAISQANFLYKIWRWKRGEKLKHILCTHKGSEREELKSFQHNTQTWIFLIVLACI